jgi:hypothetical protein
MKTKTTGSHHSAITQTPPAGRLTQQMHVGQMPSGLTISALSQIRKDGDSIGVVVASAVNVGQEAEDQRHPATV